MSEADRRNVRRYRTYLTRTYGAGTMKHLDVMSGGRHWTSCCTFDAMAHRRRAMTTITPPRAGEE